MIKSLSSSLLVVMVFQFTFSQVFANKQSYRAPQITTHEKITKKVVTEGPFNSSTIYFRSRADIQDVTDILYRVHSLKVYSVGSIILTNIEEKIINKTTAYESCHYSMSPYHTGDWWDKHYW